MLLRAKKRIAPKGLKYSAEYSSTTITTHMMSDKVMWLFLSGVSVGSFVKFTLVKYIQLNVPDIKTKNVNPLMRSMYISIIAICRFFIKICDLKYLFAIKISGNIRYAAKIILQSRLPAFSTDFQKDVSEPFCRRYRLSVVE